MLAILPPGTSTDVSTAIISRYDMIGDGELQPSEFKRFARKELHAMWDEHAKKEQNVHFEMSDYSTNELTVASAADSRDRMDHASLEMSDTSLDELLDANEISGDDLERLARLNDEEIELEKQKYRDEAKRREREMMEMRDEMIISLANHYNDGAGFKRPAFHLRMRLLCESKARKLHRWWMQGDSENPPPWSCPCPGSEYLCKSRRASPAAAAAQDDDFDEEHPYEDSSKDEWMNPIHDENATAGCCPQPCFCAIALHKVATSWFLEALITFCILFNTVTLAMDHYPIHTTLSSTLEMINFILTVIFTVEMAIKVPGIGVRMYLRNAFNAFDGFIVIVSIVEIVLSPPGFLGGSGAAGGAISALRTFRVFRLLKLARRWRRLNSLLKTVVAALQSGVYFMLLMCLFVFIYTLVGMQLFANRFYFDTWTHDSISFDKIISANASVVFPHGYYRPRSHFDTFTRSIFTIFQVLTTEDWDVVMFDARRAVGREYATLYFVSLTIVGTFVLLDFFIAILLNEFNIAHKQEEIARIQYENDERAKIAAGRGDMHNLSFAIIHWREALVSLLCECRHQRLLLECHHSKQALKVKNENNKVMVEAKELHRQRRLEGHFDTEVKHHLPPNHPEAETHEIELLEAGEGGSKKKDKAAADAERALKKLENALMSVESGNVDGEDGTDLTVLGDGLYHGPRPIVLGERNALCCIPPDWMLRKWLAIFLERSLGEMKCMRIAVGHRMQAEVWKRSGSRKMWVAGKVKGVHRDSDTFDIQLGRTDDGDAGRIYWDVDREDLRSCWLLFAKLLRLVSFENFILATIFFSSLMLAVESPLWDPASPRIYVFRQIEFVVNTIFTLETCLKILAYGAITPKRAYLRDPWNILDVFIVIIGWSTLALSSITVLKSLKTLRLLRVLRVLRR